MIDKILFILTVLLLVLSSSVQAGFFWSTDNDTNKLLGKPVYIRIIKDENALELYIKQNKQYRFFKKYAICQYSGGLGPKKRENDLKSPEGFYQITKKALNPNSRYHLSFNIGYPNRFDQNHGYTGRFLMVHGDCVSQGCYAIGNDNIDEVYRFVEQALNQGQSTIPIHIYPFKMTRNNLARYSKSEHYDFWKQLKPAYDLFEKDAQPPHIFVINKQYMALPASNE